MRQGQSNPRISKAYILFNLLLIMAKRKLRKAKSSKIDWKFYVGILLTVSLFLFQYYYPSVVVVIEKDTSQHGLKVSENMGMTFTITSTVTITRTSTSTESLH